MSDSKKLNEKIEEFYQWLQGKPEIFEKFSEYSDSAIETFLRSYAKQKATLHMNGNIFAGRDRQVMEQCMDQCWFALLEIQAKKLFDAQCRWRAHQIDEMEGIECSYDFEFLKIPLLDYQGIEPINKDDIQFYIQYLKVNDDDRIGLSIDQYQDYDAMKNEFVNTEGNDVIPQYFEYHSLVTGQNLLVLPNTRGEQDDYYSDLAREYWRNNILKTPPATPTSQKLTYISGTDSDLLEFAKMIKDWEMSNYMNDIIFITEENDDYHVEWAISYLNKCFKENIPIKGAARWQDAVYQAAMRHLNNLVIDTLPAVFEEVQLKKSLGLSIGLTKYESSPKGRINYCKNMWEIGKKIASGKKVTKKDFK